jgi:hypothetical protein
MNLRRGLFRIWIVASLIWFVGWLAYVWATCTPMHISGTPENEYVQFCYTSLFQDWMRQRQDFAFWDYASIGATGIGIPFAVLILGAGFLWAADGFRSDKEKPE